MASASNDDFDPIPEPPAVTYNTSAAARAALQKHGKENGYSLVLKRSKPNAVPEAQKRVFYLECDRHGIRPSKSTGLRNRTSRGIGCTYSVVLRRTALPPNERWIHETFGFHNHGAAQPPPPPKPHKPRTPREPSTSAAGAQSAKVPKVKSGFSRDLVGQVAVITGASRGIGRAIALNLARRGCSILGTCVSNIEGIASLEGEVRSKGDAKVEAIVADIYQPECATLIADALELHFDSKVNIFVNNATCGNVGSIGSLSVENVQESLIGNIQTPVLIVEELVKRNMFQPQSRIIYISSIRSRQPWAEQLMYSAGKSAGESLCRTWAEAFGGKDERYAFMAGTTANAVTVGLTQTDSVLQCPEDLLTGFKNEFLPLQSIPRFGVPEDVGDVVGLLCSKDARWITGQVISASGGGMRIG